MSFEEWFSSKDFYILEKMKEEFKKEYYARSAWFVQQKKIDQLEKENKELKDIIKNYTIGKYQKARMLYEKWEQGK